MVSVIPFSEKHTRDFKQLNMEWLRQYFTAELYDQYQLSNPQSEIIDKGGYVFLAQNDDTIIGTVALMREHDNSFELTKMSVTKEWQGKGVSRLLMNACIQKAQEKKWHRLLLYSNTKLEIAIQLYRKYGFVEIPLEPDSQYTRTNIKMQLLLS